MSAFNELWKKFRKKTYREEFVAAQLKRGIPFQIRALMQEKGLSQEKLAESSGLTQGVISRAANPNYGNLTLNTVIRIAAGFDVAFVGRFVPFSEIARWFVNFSEEEVGRILRFEEEDQQIQRKPPGREQVEDAIGEKASGRDRKAQNQNAFRRLLDSTERLPRSVLVFSSNEPMVSQSPERNETEQLGKLHTGLAGGKTQ